MVKYECLFCKFYSDKKANYQRHIKTKKHFNNLVFIEGNENSFEKKKELIMTQKTPNNFEIKPTKFECEKCGKTLSKKCHLYRHYKTCKGGTSLMEGYNEIVNKLLIEKDKSKYELLAEKDKQINKLIEAIKTVNGYNVYNTTMNNTNYVIQVYNYLGAESMNKICYQFRLTRDEYVKAALTSDYQDALIEKADNIIIKPYKNNLNKRPMHTVDMYRKKALYKDDKHSNWTTTPTISLSECFDQFHQSAIEQRDKIILENEEYIPHNEEESLYKQIYFIPTENQEKNNIIKKVKGHIYKETLVKKKGQNNGNPQIIF
jgi:hypothetical protein